MILDMTLIDRLQKYMEYKSLNANRMTKEAGLSIGLIGRAISKYQGLSSETIEKLLNTYTDLSAEWLLVGRGDMLNKDFSGEIEKMSNINKKLSSSLKLMSENLANSQNQVMQLIDLIKEIENNTTSQI